MFAEVQTAFGSACSLFLIMPRLHFTSVSSQNAFFLSLVTIMGGGWSFGARLQVSWKVLLHTSKKFFLLFNSLSLFFLSPYFLVPCSVDLWYPQGEGFRMQIPGNTCAHNGKIMTARFYCVQISFQRWK